MSDGGQIPSDMWGALIRIEGTTSRSEAKIDALTTEIRDVKAQVADLEHRVAPIEAELAARKLQVAEFQSLKLKVAAIDSWKTSEETTSRNAKSWVGGLWGVFGGGFVSAVTFFAASYYQAQPPVNAPVTTHVTVPQVQQAKPHG